MNVWKHTEQLFRLYGHLVPQIRCCKLLDGLLSMSSLLASPLVCARGDCLNGYSIVVFILQPGQWLLFLQLAAMARCEVRGRQQGEPGVFVFWRVLPGVAAELQQTLRTHSRLTATMILALNSYSLFHHII